jgi:hypothetical protein
MDSQEFDVKDLPGQRFRVGRISPVDLLALTGQLDFDDFTKSKTLYAFALEHTEASVGDKWVPVKVEGREVYMPLGIDQNMTALSEICEWFFENVIKKTFTKSGE